MIIEFITDDGLSMAWQQASNTIEFHPAEGTRVVVSLDDLRTMALVLATLEEHQ